MLKVHDFNLRLFKYQLFLSVTNSCCEYLVLIYFKCKICFRHFNTCQTPTGFESNTQNVLIMKHSMLEL